MSELIEKIIDECDVIDIHGNHCPEMPVHHFERNGEDVSLCDRCYRNYENGAYKLLSSRGVIEPQPKKEGEKDKALYHLGVIQRRLQNYKDGSFGKAKLDKIAEQTGVSRNKLITEAIDKYLKEIK